MEPTVTNKLRAFTIRTVEKLLYPFYGYFNNRFQDVFTRLQRIEDKRATEHLTREVASLASEFHQARKRQEADLMVIQEVLLRRDAGEKECPDLASTPLAAHDGFRERVIEIPFAWSRLGSVPRGGRVLDLGSSESGVPLSLAMLGYSVTALDPRPSPFTHPNLTAVETDITDWTGPEEPQDAILCISTLQHFGGGHRGPEHGRDRMDLQVLDRCREWLKPNGRLVFTAPYGIPRLTNKERIYGPDFIEILRADWKLEDLRIFRQASPERWDEHSSPDLTPEWSEETRGVMMALAGPR